MGHIVEIAIIAGIVLAIFGPKALQEMARNTGKGIGQAKSLKENFLSEMPVKEFHSVVETVSKVPTNPAQAMQMMVKKTLLPAEHASEKSVEPPSSKSIEPSVPETKSEA